MPPKKVVTRKQEENLVINKAIAKLTSFGGGLRVGEHKKEVKGEEIGE